MKKLLLSLVLFASLVKAQTQQDYNNASPSGIDPVIGMTSNGESESVKMANEALKANKPSKIGQNLERSLEKVENLETPTFEEVHQNTPPSESRNANKSENQGNEIDPFGSPEDKNPSWQGEKVDVDKYYNTQKDGSYIRKDLNNPNQGKDNSNILYAIILILVAGLAGVLITNQKKAGNNHDAE